MELLEKDEEYIISLIKQGKKVEAVVFVKDKIGMNLKEAKDYIEKLILKKNIHLLDKRTQEIEKIELSDKFEIKSLRTNIWWLFLYIIFFIILIFILSSLINILLKELTYKHIFYSIIFIGVIIFNCYNFLRELKSRKYFLTINGKTIKIYYENNEKEIITTENINYVSFFALRRGKRGRERKPTLQLFDLEERILAEMTIEVIDYFRLKRYLKKYNVEIVDNYEWS